jgi:hypothetical protein
MLREVTYERGRIRGGSKKVKMVDVLSIQKNECRIYKPIEITIGKRLN